jgi:hypothetical protein
MEVTTGISESKLLVPKGLNKGPHDLKVINKVGEATESCHRLTDEPQGTPSYDIRHGNISMKELFFAQLGYNGTRSSPSYR